MYHCRSCQIKNTVIYLHISPHEITIISSWYPHSQCVFTSSGPFQHWEPRAVWVVEVVLRRISATWRAWVSSLGDDELKLAWFGMKGGGKKIGKYGHMNMIHHDTMFNDGLFHFFIRMVGCHRDCHNTLYTESRYSGWWLTYPSETYEFVSWDDEIPNIWKVIEFHGSLNHQPEKESFHEASSNGMWLQGSVGVVVWWMMVNA